MNDSINRQAVFNTVTEYRNQLREIFGDENELIRTVDIVKHRLIALPSAQPEIIHCEECVYRKDNFMGDWCTCWCGWTSLDGYCHKGANKDE